MSNTKSRERGTLPAELINVEPETHRPVSVIERALATSAARGVSYLRVGDDGSLSIERMVQDRLLDELARAEAAA